MPASAQPARPPLHGVPPSPQLLVVSTHSSAPVVSCERHPQLLRVRGDAERRLGLPACEPQPLSTAPCNGIAITQFNEHLSGAQTQLVSFFFSFFYSTLLLFPFGSAVFSFPSECVVPISSSRSKVIPVFVSKNVIFCFFSPSLSFVYGK